MSRERPFDLTMEKLTTSIPVRQSAPVTSESL